MSDVAASPPFGGRALGVLIALGVLLMLGFLLISGFGNALTPANPLHPSATSRAAIGFAGVRDLVERLNLAGEDGDAIGDWDHPGLLILTPRVDTTPEQITDIITYRSSSELATLVVLPKWAVSPAEGNSDWAEGHGLLPIGSINAIFPQVDDGIRSTIGRTGPAETLGPEGFVLPATVQATPLDPFNETEARNTVVILTDHPGEVYLMTDPDLINNIGMKSAANAAAAIRLFGELSELSGPTEIAFDLSLPKGADERNLIQLMFTPPFLAVTIAVFAAALLAGLASANRFGPVRREARTVAFGKAALIENIANLTRAAGRVTGGGSAYADAFRERMRARLQAPAMIDGTGLDGDALDAWFDARHPTRRYSEIDRRLRAARTEAALLNAARDMHDWQREVQG